MNKLILYISVFAIFTNALFFSNTLAGCQNSTGTCTDKHFICANEQRIEHKERCDGIEHCADGTDEYMCDYQEKFSDRLAYAEVSCIKCTCLKGSLNILSTGVAAWWKIATLSPRDITLLTSAPNKQNKPCNPSTTTEIKLNLYKKRNKGCRGFVCCFRQEQCVSCSGGNLPGNNCYP